MFLPIFNGREKNITKTHPSAKFLYVFHMIGTTKPILIAVTPNKTHAIQEHRIVSVLRHILVVTLYLFLAVYVRGTRSYTKLKTLISQYQKIWVIMGKHQSIKWSDQIN